MNTPSNSDHELLQGLKSRDYKIINYLYKKYYHEVQVLVTNNSGSKTDAEDVFQDVLIILYQKSSDKDFVLSCSLNTYLYSVGRHLWFRKLRKYPITSDIDGLSEKLPVSDGEDLHDLQVEEERYSLFRHHFLQLSPDDQKVLNLYMNKTPAKETASIMGYKSENYAKFRKYICKEKLKNSIANDIHFRNYCQSA